MLNMNTSTVIPEGFKSWKEYSQHRKSLKRKWNEEKIMKKISKTEEQSKKEAALAKEEAEKVKSCNVSTISIAVPGSILENAQSPELRSYLASQIARAACIFSVDEIIVYDDIGDKINTRKSKIDDIEGTKISRKSCVQLARILQYLECPQYLRKFFFPIHDDLRFAGILNPLDAPHHLRANNDFHFREGITMNKNVKPGRGSQVNVGLLQDVSVDKLLTPGIRVTVRMLPTSPGSKKLHGKVESLSTPRAETGVYWGYVVRIANTLSEVFSKSPYKNGYDVTIGTSDKGVSLDSISDNEIKYDHTLILFGGLQGIEAALESDEQLAVDDASLLFDYYINSVPTQGSRTIRTEEAILVTMSALRKKLEQKNKVKDFIFADKIAQSSNFNNANKSDITIPGDKKPKLTLEHENDFSRFD